MSVLICVCVLIIILNGSSITHWNTDSSVLPYEAQCIIGGYNHLRGYGVIIGGKTLENKVHEYIYNFTINSKDINNIVINFEDTNEFLPESSYSCNGPLSTILDERIYYVNENNEGHMLTSIPMKSPFKVQEEVQLPQGLYCSREYESMCLTNDNKRTLYLVCASELYYYDIFNSRNWEPLPTAKYNHISGTCKYVNDRVYVISGQNDCYVEYYDIKAKRWHNIGCLNHGTYVSNTLSMYDRNGDIFVLGGKHYNNSNSTTYSVINTVFDININNDNITETTVDPLPLHIVNMFGIYVNYHMFLFGGIYQDNITSEMKYSNKIYYSTTNFNTSSPTVSPTKSTESPTKSTLAPTIPTKAPTKHSQSPTKSTKTPTMDTTSPTSNTQSPTSNTQSPTANTQSPTKSTKAPTISTFNPTLPPNNSSTLFPTNSPIKSSNVSNKKFKINKTDWIIIGSLLGLFICLALLYCHSRRRKKNKPIYDLHKQGTYSSEPDNIEEPVVGFQ